MPQTHDYPTRPVDPVDLDSTMVLVGDSGGLSAIVGDVEASNTMPGMVRVETEHGPLYLDPEEPADVLDMEASG